MAAFTHPPWVLQEGRGRRPVRRATIALRHQGLVKTLPDVAEQARRLPAKGLLVFRWLSLAWIVVLAATGSAGAYRPALTWMAVAALVAWTAWLTRRHSRSPVSLSPVVLEVDLAVATALVMAAGLAAQPGALDSGPSLASYYPAVAVVAWGLARGPYGGILAAAMVVGGLALGRLLNDSSLVLLQGRHIAALANDAIGYLLVGIVIGGFSRLVDRMARTLETAMGDALREQAKVSRMRERESLGRQIHDSVLQALTLVHKRGRELAASANLSPAQVLELAELARQQELSLRRLILSGPAPRDPGQSSLREVLDVVVDGVAGLAVELSVAGRIELRRRDAEELAAVVKEALANVVKHAEASRATVFAEQDAETVVVSIRDDGKGFTLDEAALCAAHKAGILRSMKGRVEDMGGAMRIESAPGRGTEVEVRIPLRDVHAGAGHGSEASGA